MFSHINQNTKQTYSSVDFCADENIICRGSTFRNVHKNLQRSDLAWVGLWLGSALCLEAPITKSVCCGHNRPSI